ncbi:hypothetical protein EV426DRAFT_717055 [Tirmania nivea]|nr:hypothetical protein EV426DRAFT_717055 [Tirmania nivea]
MKSNSGVAKETPVCDTILAVESNVGDEKAMKDDAKISLRNALDTDDLYVETVGRDLCIGNLQGLEYARYRSERNHFEERLAALEEREILKDVKIASLEDRVTNLTVSLDSYHVLRNRFLSTFKRDKLGNATEADFRLISEGEGNNWAHGGDAIADALLYQKQRSYCRRDVSTYKRLYGLDPARVLEISYKPTIDAVNAHAAVVASNHKTGSTRFYEKFAEFLKTLEEKDYEEKYLEDMGNLELDLAYWAFLKCFHDEVSDNNDAEDRLPRASR